MAVEDDLNLVERVVRKEQGAYEVLVGRIRGVVESCLSRVRRTSPWIRDDVDDLRQRFDLFLIEDDYRVLKSFAGRSALTTFIHVTAFRFFHRHALSLKTERARRADVADELPDAAPSPEAEQLRRTAVQRVKAALAELSDEDRVLLALDYEHELSSQQISEALGLKPSAVRMRKQRLIAKIRQKLEEGERP